MEQNVDLIASALLSELKTENERKTKVIRGLLKIICGCVVSIMLTVGIFLLYLNQYDFCGNSISTINAEGVYTLVDSEGNVIAQDLSPEEIREVLNGPDNSCDQKDASTD